MRQKHGKILYSKNADTKLYPASTTKILTAILAIEHFKLDEKLTASYDAVMAIPAGYSNAEIQVGEALTVHELLQVFLVHSANEAGYIFAESISGSVSGFADLMNEKALEIGCQNTHFTNPSGLHDKDHYTTAHDLAKIARYCMSNQTFRSIVSMPSCTIAPTDKHEERYFTNTNEILHENSKYYDENVIGIKTGFTTPAKNCLISAYQKDDTELISVVLGAPTNNENGLSGKYSDTKTLFNYGMNNFSMRTVVAKDDVIYRVKIDGASSETQNLDLILEKDISVFLNNNYDLNSIKPEINIDEESLSAPIEKNTILGTVTYNLDGKAYTSNLLASHDVESFVNLELILKLIFGVIILAVFYKLIYAKPKKKNKKKKKSNGKYLYGRVKY